MVVRPRFYESIGVSIIFGGERMQQILFLTNMEQTATYLQDALKLAQQTQKAVAGQVLYVPSDTEWTKDMEKQLQ